MQEVSFGITPNQFTITWPTIPGRTYIAQWSSDLQIWNELPEQVATSITLSNTLDQAAIDSEDGILGNLGELFVRVTVTPPRL